MHKRPRFSKSLKKSRLTNDTKTPSLGESEGHNTKYSPRNPSSKALTKETDPYCDLSVSYTSDFPEGQASEVLLTNARNSLIDLRCEAQMYLDSSKRAANKRSKESLFSQPDSINRSVIVNDQLTHLIQSMHESMRDLKIQLESVDRKYERSESFARDLRDSVVELNEKITELRMEKSCECSNRCFIM
jgi:hypothetical protein